MRTSLQKSAESRRANFSETKSRPLGRAIWLAVLGWSVWAVDFTDGAATNYSQQFYRGVAP
jgi:hypothetical protein